MDEMESLRIESELEKQQFGSAVRGTENRDSGVADVDDNKSSSSASSSTPDQNVAKRTALLSNSLLDMTDQQTLRRKSIFGDCSTLHVVNAPILPVAVK